jgi:D-arabinose 5-phosphate isomerase GutQ
MLYVTRCFLFRDAGFSEWHVAHLVDKQTGCVYNPQDIQASVCIQGSEVQVADVVELDLVARARAVIEQEARGVGALAEQFDGHLAGVVDLLFHCQGHVLVTGAGTSHAMGQRFAHLLSCSGTPALCINPADCLHGGAGAITARDVLFVISKGGQTAEINQLVEIAHARGAKVIAQTEDPASPLAQCADAIYPVCAVGDVDPYGMIATGSSLINGAAGDVLCVLLLERRGYTREAFGQTHPGGAVGHMVAAAEGEGA